VIWCLRKHSNARSLTKPIVCVCACKLCMRQKARLDQVLAEGVGIATRSGKVPQGADPADKRPAIGGPPDAGINASEVVSQLHERLASLTDLRTSRRMPTMPGSRSTRVTYKSPQLAAQIDLKPSQARQPTLPFPQDRI
jgi:hypothetical protein